MRPRKEHIDLCRVPTGKKIKHVMSGLNPQGCQVYSFKLPSAEELDHNFLWRYARVLPERGRIGIFNRSYFEEVLIVKVHKALLEAERIPNAKAEPGLWAGRYEDISHYDRHLGAEVLPQRLAHRTAQAIPQTTDRSRQALEVLVERPRRAGVLGPVHAGLRGHADRDQHRMGPLARDPGGSQMGRAGPGGADHRRGHRPARPAVPEG